MTLTLRQFISQTLCEYGDQASQFQMSLDVAKLDIAIPMLEDGWNGDGWEDWEKSAHVWTATNSYALQIVQDGDTGEVETRTTMVPRAPSGYHYNVAE